jgi:hypothetical protein
LSTAGGVEFALTQTEVAPGLHEGQATAVRFFTVECDGALLFVVVVFVLVLTVVVAVLVAGAAAYRKATLPVRRPAVAMVRNIRCMAVCFISLFSFNCYDFGAVLMSR